MKATRRVLTSTWDYDVVINGGGIVGAAVAADLTRNFSGQLKVAVIEPSKVKPLRTTRSLPDARTYALSPRSIQYLDRLGAWKYVEPRSHPYKSMQIWESSGPGLVKFHAREMKVDELGRICEDATVQSAIYKSIEESGHKIEYINSHVISDVEVPTSDSFFTDPVNLKLVGTADKADGRSITSRLLIGADGGASAVRRLSGISTWGWSYGQEAVVATISIRDQLPTDGDGPISPLRNYNNTAWQKYLPTGPLGILPLWDGYASIVWSLPHNEAKKMKGLSNEEFLVRLNEAIRTPPKTDRWSVLEPNDATTFPPFINSFVQYVNKASAGTVPLDRMKQEAAAVLDAIMSAGQLSDPFTLPYEIKHVCGPRLSFPLSFQQAKHYTANRVALIGDAAHSIHPQAGQGLNLGLMDAAKLAEVIKAAVASGEDYGTTLVLDRYGKERYREDLLMLSVVDVLNSVFKDRIDVAGSSVSEDSVLVKGKQLVRSLGMLGVHNLGQLKHQMAKFAMGVEQKGI